MLKRPMIGLALGGGGARGIAHIGVLKVLEREKIPIDLIVGSSIGALVGAAYAIHPDTRALENRVCEVLGPESNEKSGLKLLAKVQWDNDSKTDFLHRLVRIAQKEVFLSLAMFRNALLSKNEIRECVEAFVSDVDLRETKIPFAAAAVDLVTGEQVILKQGPIISAVMASCAVPGFMPTTTWNDMILVDGGILNTVPANLLRDDGVDVVIGVDVGSHLCQPCPIEDGIDAINRAMEIMAFYLSKQGKKSADILIEPDVKEFTWTGYSNYDKLIRQGQKAAESKIEEIHKLIKYPIRKKVILWPKKIVGKMKNRHLKFPSKNLS